MADKKNENKNADKEKLEALYSAISQIEKHHGKGSIMKMGEGAIEDRIEVIPTGSLTLDLALGVGGVPKGRIIEIYGPESSGKTTLALSIVGECQKTGGRAAFIDAEHAFDPSYAKDIGVNVDELFISQPDSGEQALDIAETLIRSGGIDILIIDSVAALTPKAEIEGEMGDSHMGLQARLMSQALRKLTGITSKTKTTVIFINQIREKIGVLFGNPETTTGGRSLKFYASIRMDIRRTQSLTDKGEAYGNRTKVKVVKNKVAPPFKEAEFDLIFGKGISKEGGILDVAINLKIVEAQGAWIKYNGQNISQGRENARDLLKSKPELANEIEGKVREAMSNKQHAKENIEDKEK